MYHHRKAQSMRLINSRDKIQNNMLKSKTHPESGKGGILLSWSKLDIFSKHANLLELIVLELLDGLVALHK